MNAYNSSVSAPSLPFLSINPDNPATAILVGNEACSYAELASRIDHLVEALAACAGKVIGVAVLHPVDRLALILAIIRAGGYALPLHPAIDENIDDLLEALGNPPVIGDQHRQVLFSTPGGFISYQDNSLLFPDHFSLPVSAHDQEGGLVLRPVKDKYSTDDIKGVFRIPASVVQKHLEYSGKIFSLRPGTVLCAETLRQNFDLLEWALPALYTGACLSFSEKNPFASLSGDQEGLLVLSIEELNNLIRQAKTEAAPKETGRFRLVVSDHRKLDRGRLEEWRHYFPECLPALYTFRLPDLFLSIAQTNLAAEERFSAAAGAFLPLTAPFGRVNLQILDSHGHRTLVNVKGDLVVESECLSRPFGASRVSALAVPSGYKARFTAEAKIQLLNLSAREVQLGERIIETDLVEEALESCKGVHRCSVRSGFSGEKPALIAFIEAGEPIPPRAVDLRKELSELLPLAKVPDYFCFIDKLDELLPGTELPDGWYTFPLETGVATASGPVEHTLLEIWQDLLKMDSLGVDDHFFELGGHSLLATQLIARIHQQFGKAVALRDIFDYPTIVQQAQLIERQAASAWASIPHVEIQDYYPTSNAQKRLWIVTQMESDLAAYNTFLAFHLQGQLEVSAFDQAVKHVVERHEILRTTFVQVNGEPKQRIHAPQQFPSVLEVVDLRDSNSPVPEALAAMEQKATTPFALDKGPLLHIGLYQLPANSFYLFLSIHHIISDGWSNNLLVREILENYHAFIEGKESSFHALDIQYKDYTAWQLGRLELPELQEHRRFWLDSFANLPPALQLPAYKPRPAVQRYHGRTLRHLFPKKVLDQLYSLGKRANASLFMTLTAVLNVLFYKYTGQKDIILGTAATGRNHPALDDQIGFYLNTLALRNQLDPEKPFTAFMQTVRDNTLAAFEHQEYPFDRLINELDFDRDLSRHPLFDILVILQNFGDDEEGLMKQYFRDLEVHLVELDGKTSMFDLDLEFQEGKDALSLLIHYNTDVFEHEQIENLCAHFDALVEQLALHKERPVGYLSVLTAEEKEQLIYTFNDTCHEFPLERSYHHYLEQYAIETPEKTALIGPNQQLSYASLNAEVNQLARQLLKQTPIEPDGLVAIFMSRSEQMAKAILAVWKSGGAYIPIERRLPDNRIIATLADAGVSCILTERAMISDEAFEQALREQGPVYYIEDLLHAAGNESTENLNRYIDPHSLSFVIFTSGSTGKPKGAMNEHIGMMNHALATADYLGIDRDSVLVQNASHSFDISVWQFFTAFLGGGTTVIYDDQMVADPEQFLRRLDKDRVSILQVVPSYLSMLLDLIEKAPQNYSFHLKHLICCGEAINPVLVRRWLNLYDRARIVNDYGPAEASDGTSWYLFDDLPADLTNIPIGRSIYNMSTYVVDEYMNLCPAGVIGELCVAGVGVGRGYLKDEERTKLVFLTDPFAPEKQQKLYKTGDLGRYLPNGLLEFYGRKDYQVKVNGQRLELGEIEVKLCQIPGVKNASVIDLNDQDGRKYLCGFVVLHTDQAPSVSEIRSLLSGELPPYMIPRTIQVLDTLPITPNGKTDRKALARLGAGATEEISTFIPPASPVEKVLAEAWEAVLKKSRVGVTDNFYDAGGDSISAIQVAAHLYKAGFKVDIKDILRRPTIRELVPYLQTAGRMASQESISGPVSLLPIQADFFAVQKSNPHQYHLSVLLKSNERLLKDKLEEALNKLLDVHDALRATFEQKEGEIMQQIQAPGTRLRLACHDIRNAQDPALAMNTIAVALDKSIRLNEYPLLRAALLQCSDADYLYLTAHHLLVDGISWRILLEDLSKLYSQLSAGTPVEMPLKTDSIDLWSQSLQAYTKSESFRKEQLFWQQLEQYSFEPIRRDYPGEAPGKVENMRELTFRLEESRTTELLTQAHQAFNTSVDELLLTAFGRATQYLFGVDKIVVMLEGHGRSTLGDGTVIDRSVGWFTSEYPVCLDMSHTSDLGRQIKSVKEALRQVPAGGVGYGLWKSGQTQRKRPQIVFNYLGQFEEQPAAGPFLLMDQSLGESEAPENESDYPLEIIGITRKGQISLSIRYHLDQFSEKTLTRWMEVWQQAILEVIDFCLAQEKTAFTPSDFDYKDLTMNDLEELEFLFL